MNNQSNPALFIIRRDFAGAQAADPDAERNLAGRQRLTHRVGDRDHGGAALASLSAWACAWARSLDRRASVASKSIRSSSVITTP